MWRLIISELVGRPMYKGQRLLFLGTIKAQIKTIYIQGEKVQSAFFNSSTKPIFRSESARYVLFVQMSKEMWDFDTEGTGEIMFHKVINGFLPELFKRWEDMGTRHLVSIILFTRMEYERTLPEVLAGTYFDDRGYNIHSTVGDVPSKDFYRVLVSDMATGRWTDILIQLKREFRTFLRDISIRKTFPQDFLASSLYDTSTSAPYPSEVIEGQPTSATRGNILEAINLASSQFSGDYIDRDLVRTGLSIVVITPGTGVFEVDHKMLSMTTDTLIENGVGIDLVCLARMPLHSVPLFKYQQPNATGQVDGSSSGNHNDLPKIPDPVDWKSRLKNANPLSDFPTSVDDSSRHTQDQSEQNSWHYGIPHWIDISFWTASIATPVRRSLRNGTPATADKLITTAPQQFVPRVSMYELQMMGITENETRNVSIPYLSQFPIVTHRSNCEQGEWNTKPDNRGFHDDRPSINSKDSTISTLVSSDEGRIHGNLLPWMDDYDDSLFRHPLHDKSTWRASKLLVATMPQVKSSERESRDVNLSNSLIDSEFSSNSMFKEQFHSSSPQSDRRRPVGAPIQNIGLPRTKSKTGKPQKGLPYLSRQISSGLRGVGKAAPKAIPIIELSSENVQSAALLTHGPRPHASVSQSKLKSMTTEWLDQSPSAKLESALSRQSVGDSLNKLKDQEASTPIAIKTSNEASGLKYKPTNSTINSLRQEFSEVANSDIVALSPKSALAPWLTVLNPSNPHKLHISQSSRLGRWQHIFPRPLRVSNIKWRSLCSPASVPLTIEDFPTPDELAARYQESVYLLSSATEDDLAEEEKPRGWLVQELIGARLSHGFQIIIGRQAEQGDGSASGDDENWTFRDEQMSSIDTTISMSRGGTIHQFRYVEGSILEVKLYVRKPMNITVQEEASIMYKPAVRTTLSAEYISRKYTISSSHEVYDWQRLDSFVAAHEEQNLERYPDHLHYWRARFVLIPVEHTPQSRRSTLPIDEDNEEEVRLEGIRKLTQVWQKHRYIPISERRFQISSRKRKDTNPLDIVYQTRTPSAVVATWLDSALLLGVESNEGNSSQLLPEDERFERDNLNLSALSQAIQSERGVKLLDRRWHVILHYNCFIGIEFTTWLLDNFKDIDTREEAVELGEDLRKAGLFQHVSQRHNFRDSNFFYRIASEYRAHRTEPKTRWFGSRRSDLSVPLTPMTEAMRDYTTGPRTRSACNEDSGSDDGSPMPMGRQTSVTLSKRLTYDVDHRKRSYRNEFINLHYDRISSADDCYHLRIDWMGVTPKLIEDSIVGWATTAERYGLRLVELPIAEASKINELHPFRAPFLIKLASKPPERQPQNHFDATSFAPQTGPRHAYQKEILKKFNFILDLEAAKDFPPSVEVMYSWGKPDYQYPQYISRDGVVLAQITDDGEFLLLANRLYNNRSASTKESGKAGTADWSHRAMDNHRPPGYGGTNIPNTSPPVSPFSSPMVRATADVGLEFARSELITPEKIANELDRFCSDGAALKKFYEEVLSQSSSPELDTAVMEGTIPPLGIPAQLNAELDLAACNSEDIHGSSERRGKSRSPQASRRVE